VIVTGGIYKGRKIIAPDERYTRPTLSKVRQGVFNTLFSLIGDFEGKTFLDLFGGSGIMGIEALSRGFEEVLVFEKNINVAKILKKNYLALGLKENLIIGNSLNLLKKIDKTFDVIYIDPPYYSGIYDEIFKILNSSINSNSLIIIEHCENLNIEFFEILKEKIYGDKKISFISKKK